VFALKQMSKHEIVSKRLHNHAMNEKRCLQSLCHPGILTLFKTFHDRDSIFMLTEYCAGPELYQTIQRPSVDQAANYPKPGLKEKIAKFFAACMLSALEFMNRKGVAHRDLKSENVLVNADGYLKIIDWGFAKHIPCTRVNVETGEEYVDNQSFTMCGTPEYFAPEMILNVGCTRAIDVWTFGIVMYEMYAGNTPFLDVEDRGNMKQMFVKVLGVDTEGVPFNPNLVEQNPDAMDFISRCLRAESTLRAAPVDLKEDSYMDEIDWQQMDQKLLRAPWIPHDDFFLSAGCNKKKRAVPKFKLSELCPDGKDPLSNF